MLKSYFDDFFFKEFHFQTKSKFMIHGKPIQHCPLIPFILQNFEKLNFQDLKKILINENEKLHLIFITKGFFKIIQFPEFVNIYNINIQNKMKSNHYFDFLNAVFNIFAHENNGYELPKIGVVSNKKKPDFVCYLIVRYLFNECGFSLNQSLAMVKDSFPPGITKQKYLRMLSRVTGEPEDEIDLNFPLPEFSIPEEEKKVHQSTSKENLELFNSRKMVNEPSKSFDNKDVALQIQDKETNTENNTDKSKIYDIDQNENFIQVIQQENIIQYVSEVIELTKLPNANLLFLQFSPITTKVFDLIKSDTNNIFCLMLEPLGQRGILYVRRRIPIIIYEQNSQIHAIQINIIINVPNENSYIFDIVYIKGKPSTIVLCDVMYSKNELVMSRPFNYRMSIINDLYSSIFTQIGEGQPVKFGVRPFYPMKSYSALLELFLPKPRKIFSRYPVCGISIASISSGTNRLDECIFLWESEVTNKPKVIIQSDLSKKSVFGYCINGSTIALIAYLGDLNPEIYNLDGKTVEIEVIEQNSNYETLLNAKIIRVTNDHPWSISMFLRWYPNRHPNLNRNQLSSNLEQIASQPRYSQ